MKPEIVMTCDVCGLPFQGEIVIIDGHYLCGRKHPGDAPDFTPWVLSLAERLAFFKEAKEIGMTRNPPEPLLPLSITEWPWRREP
jgi:hypothetical protein